eukprot:g3340.t1
MGGENFFLYGRGGGWHVKLPASSGSDSAPNSDLVSQKKAGRGGGVTWCLDNVPSALPLPCHSAPICCPGAWVSLDKVVGSSPKKIQVTGIPGEGGEGQGGRVRRREEEDSTVVNLAPKNYFSKMAAICGSGQIVS